MRTILVTGGAGFLGSHLCDRLIQTDRVVCLDDFSTGQRSNVRHLLGHDGFTLIERDVTEPLQGELASIDRIFHLASPASPVTYQQSPIRTLDTNFTGTKRMLELAAEQGARLLLTSTSEVYGDPKQQPQGEDYWGNVNPSGVRSCYDEGKRAAEALCAAYRRERGLDVRVVRVFNTYGPRMAPDDGRVISNFVVAALTARPLRIYGSGEQTRSFCYVDDMIEGFVRAMDFEAPPSAVPDVADVTVNLGNAHEHYTIAELAERVRALTDSSSIIEFRPLPRDDPRDRRPATDRAGRLLGWKPSVDLDTGLRRTIEYYQRELDLT